VSNDLIKILLVDDTPSNLTALEAMLATSSCHLVRAQSADEALLALLEEDYAAVVLDIKMPGISGFELARLIKERKRTRHIPILFVTAYLLDEADMLRGYEAGAVSYLAKPINPVVLQSKIAVFADLFRHRRALAESNESLKREVAERLRAEEALRVANRDLEARVLERTEALREADRRKDEFLAMLAHELRNPLAPIGYAVRILDEADANGPEPVHARRVITRQLSQLSRLIDDLLDVSRISHGVMELKKELVALTDVVELALESCRPRIGAGGIELQVSLPPGRVVLDGDRVRLAQCLINLVNNSVRHTPAGGKITIQASHHDGDVVISVEDTGSGIPPESLERVFEMFTRLKRNHGGVEPGLGVGLALVRKIVELHGGAIDARSDGPGRGAEFTIRLPSVPARPEAPSPTPPSQPTGAPRHRILIAEDGRDAADSFGMLLRIMGHEVRIAYDGQEAVTEAGAFRPGVIFMDVGMPRLNGYDAARAIRSQPWGKDIFLIALTGWGQADDRRRSREAGFDRHLTKPVDPEDLGSLLSTVGDQATDR
jgi:signal transduction histidine kinase